MDNTLGDRAIVEAVLPYVIKCRQYVSRDDAAQTAWVALLLAKPLKGDLVETTKRFAKELLQRDRDRIYDVLKRVEFNENALAHQRYNDGSIDVSAVVLSTLRKLDKRDNLIFRRRFLRGEKQKTIAAALGLSTSSVSQRLQHVAQVFVKEYNHANQ